MFLLLSHDHGHCETKTCCFHCHYNYHAIFVTVIVVAIQGMCLRTSPAQQATSRRAPQHCMPMTALTMLIAPLATQSCPVSMGSCIPTPSGTALLVSFMSEAGTSRYLRLSLHLFRASSALCCIPLPLLSCLLSLNSRACPPYPFVHPLSPVSCIQSPISSTPLPCCHCSCLNPGHALPICHRM